MNNHKVTVNVTNRTIVRTILWIIAAVVLFWFVRRVSHVLILVFVSFFLALALNPAVGWLSRRTKIRSRIVATSAAYVIIIALLALFFALVTPPLVKQSRQFINEIPQQVENFQHQNSSLARFARKYKFDQKLSNSARDFASNYGKFGTTILDTGKRIVEIIASILAVLVMTFMMLVEGPYWMELYWGTVPAAKRAHRKHLAHQMYKGVSGFVNGQVIIALMAGLFAFIALEVAGHILNVPTNAGALGGVVFLLGLIPLFGNPTASIIVILASLLNSLTLAVVMLIYFVVYFFIENHTFQPFIQSRLNKLTALSVFVAAILGVGVAGFLGAIVAIPAASAIKVLLEDYFKHKNPGVKPPTESQAITTI